MALKFLNNATFAGDVTMTQSSGNNMLFINSSGGGNPVMYMQDSIRKWGQYVSNGDLFFKDETSSITSLKLDGGNGNAIFAGDVAIQKTGDVYLTLESTDTGTAEEVAIKYNNQSTGSNYWWAGLNQSANYSLAYGTAYSGANVKMEISTAGNATFAGNVSLDDGKILKLGASDDYQIYHNSTTNVNHIFSNLDRQLSINANIIQLTNQANSTTYLKLESSGATFAGDVLVEDNLYLTDAGTVRGKIQLNSSDRDNLDIKAISLGSLMRFYTADTLALTLDASQNATFAGNVKLGDSSKLILGTGSDLNIFHDSANSYFENKVGDLIFRQEADGKDIIFKSDNGSGGDTEYFRIDGGSTMNVFSKPTWHGDGVKSFFGNSQDLEIYHDGTDTQITNGAGHLRIKNNADNKDISFFADNQTSGVVEYLRLDGSLGTTRFFKNARFSDNVKANFGDSEDLQIYHSGNHSYIRDVGQGSLYLQTNGAGIYLQDTDGNAMAQFSDGGGSFLFYNSNLKLSTTNTGVSVTGAATATTFLGDLNGTINTATTAVTKANATNDTTVATTAFVQNLIGTIPAGLVFQGTWNAATNTPTLTSGSGTTGHFYIVSTDGSTNLDGITDWKVGDWAVFVEQGASDQWEKVDNSSVLDGSGTGQKVTKWNGSGTSNTLTDGPITFSGNNSTFAGNLTVGSNNITGAQFYVQGTYPRIYLSDTNSNDDYSIINDNGTFVVYNDTDSSTAFSIAGNNNATFAGSIDTTAVNIKVGSAIHGTITSSSNSLTLNARNTGIMLFQSGSVEKMRIANNGNVGIGTPSPAEKLTVGGNANVTAKFAIGIAASHPSFDFYNDGTTYLNGNTTIDANLIVSNGNVGIGTTSPTSQLDVRGGAIIAGSTPSAPIGTASTLEVYENGDDATLAIHQDNGASTTKFAQIRFRNGGNDTYIKTPTSGQALIIDTEQKANAFAIHVNGNVGIGTTSPSELLELKPGSGGDSKINMVNSSGVQKALIGYDNGNGGLINLYNEAGTRNVVVRGYGNSYFNGGNFGIGTTSPGKKLDVVGNANVGVAKFSHTTNGAYGSILLGTLNLFIGDNGNYAWKNGNNTRMELSGAGALKLNTYTAGTLVSDASGNITVSSGGGAGGPYLPLAGGTMTGVTQFNDHTIYGDQVYAKWGAGNDLTIGHNATNSVISNAFGNLYISNHADDKDIIFECDNGSGSSVSYLTLDGSTTHAYFSNPGNVGIGTTSPVYKLDVNGGARAGGVVTYSKVAGSLNTTGYAVAGLTGASNGSSAGFEFKCYGGTGHYQRISYSCFCDGTTWRPRKMIDEGSNTYDVTASADGTTITFTFKTKSGSQGYSPRIVVQATGHSINSTYA